MCAKQREKCTSIVRALAAANRFILEKPDEALGLLKKRYETMDQELLAAAWRTVSKAHAKDLHVTVPGLDHSQKVSLEAKLLDAKNELKNFDGLYTDEFVK
jgi:ABC-type nitrate/sulfonate/bicarbonate transport system substrate-binding protein